jgi:hypothetical protein
MIYSDGGHLLFACRLFLLLHVYRRRVWACIVFIVYYAGAMKRVRQIKYYIGTYNNNNNNIYTHIKRHLRTLFRRRVQAGKHITLFYDIII